MRRLPLTFVCWLCLASPCFAAIRQTRLPLHNGQLALSDLNMAVCQVLNLPACPGGGQVNLSGPDGPDFLLSVNACLWRGCSLSLRGPQAILRLSTGQADGKCEGLCRMARLFTAEHAPHATAAQARNWGLLLPGKIDPAQPLVVLLHGLDADRSDCLPLGQLLQHSGYQVGYFGYPGDQPIPDSADLLARELRRLSARFPRMKVDLVPHSMGGLVARAYVEGPQYSGGIDRLIMVAPPNAGSSWARLWCILSAEENYQLHQWDPNWHWTWLLTEGMGEAGSELMPGSRFLSQLNSRPRRSGVRYTIIAGSRSGVHRLEGNCLERISNWIPRRLRHWWGFGACYRALHRRAGNVYRETGDCDGPVPIDSARLAGVDDFVVLPADHESLYLPIDGHAPAAWTVIRKRLRQ